MGTLTMSGKERRRAVIMAGVQAGELNLVGAAAVLRLMLMVTFRMRGGNHAWRV